MSRPLDDESSGLGIASAEGKNMAQPIDLMTTTDKLAQAMSASGLTPFNAGVYRGTSIKVRQLTGLEPVRLIGTTAKARIQAESWVVDRFGESVGARHVKELLRQRAAR